MFKSEQYSSQKIQNKLKQGFFRTGTTLAKDNTVKRKFTYRELSVVLGILVAIIAFTLWVKQKPQRELPESSELNTPALAIPFPPKFILEKALEISF